MWSQTQGSTRRLLSRCAPLALVFVAIGVARGDVAATEAALQKQPADEEATKRILGATSVLQEVSSGVELRARIDTGAASCSLHVEEIDVVDGAAAMRKNVGKEARIRIRDDDGKDHWIDTKIVDTVLIKNPNSDKKQRRYKVWLTLRADGVEKRVLVSLSDRSHLRYPLLIGRNFLNGDFVVDVSLSGES